jgi:hypothetical protein
MALFWYAFGIYLIICGGKIDQLRGQNPLCVSKIAD